MWIAGDVLSPVVCLLSSKIKPYFYHVSIKDSSFYFIEMLLHIGQRSAPRNWNHSESFIMHVLIKCCVSHVIPRGRCWERLHENSSCFLVSCLVSCFHPNKMLRLYANLLCDSLKDLSLTSSSRNQRVCTSDISALTDLMLLIDDE